MSPDSSKLTPVEAVSAAAGGLRPWIPWIGVVVVVGAIGGTAGVLGFFGTPAPAKAASAIVLGSGVDALDCPAGAPVAQLVGGERILALHRSSDSDYLQIRNPYNVNQDVWVSTGFVSVDQRQPAISSLPVADCPTPSVALDALPTTAPVIPTPPKPTHGGGHVTPPPAPAKDHVKPVIIKANASPTSVINDTPSTLSVVATDNVRVTSVTVKWNGEATGSATMHLVSGVWKYTFVAAPSNTGAGDIHFVFIAHDAAGNASSQATATVNHQWLG